jgi:hypothetical protein
MVGHFVLCPKNTDMETRQINGRTAMIRKEGEISELMAEYERMKTETTIPLFCKLHGIGKSTFYSWQRKYSPGYQVQPRGRFIEVKPSQQASEGGPAGQLFAIVRSAGMEVELHQVVEPGYLKALLS